MLVALGLLILILLIYAFWLYYQPTFEKFANIEPNLEEEVIALYKDLLQRQPTPLELKEAVSQLKSGAVTMDGLQQHMIDSDEYSRIIKLQSNELAPELRKMLYEKKTISYLSRVYSEVTGNALNPKLVLPIRDIFQYIEYNDIALRMVFKSPLWKNFEEDMLNSFQLNKEDVIEMFEKVFEKTKLMSEAKTRFVGQVSSIQDPPPQVQRETVTSAAPINEPSLLLTTPTSPTIEGFTSDMSMNSSPVLKDGDYSDMTKINLLPPKETFKVSNNPQPVEDGKAFETFASKTEFIAQDTNTFYKKIQEDANNIFNKDKIATALD